MNNLGLGKKGEDLACQTLTQKGFKIINRNYRTPYGELDIIAKDQHSINFCEVKTRCSFKYGRGDTSIGYFKQKHIVKSVYYWLANHQSETTSRADIKILALIVNFLGKMYRVDIFRLK